RHQVPHEQPGAPDHAAELLHTLVTLVRTHQLAEVDDAVGREQRGELVPQAEVDDTAVAGEQLVDGKAIVGGELGHGALLLDRLPTAARNGGASRRSVRVERTSPRVRSG